MRNWNATIFYQVTVVYGSKPLKQRARGLFISDMSLYWTFQELLEESESSMMSLLQPPSQNRHSDSGQMVAKLLPGIFIEILATPRSARTLAGVTIHRNAKLVKNFSYQDRCCCGWLDSLPPPSASSPAPSSGCSWPRSEPGAGLPNGPQPETQVETLLKNAKTHRMLKRQEEKSCNEKILILKKPQNLKI